jgi:hypothetical protein
VLLVATCMRLWRWLLGGNRYVLVTLLTASQCIARLNSITAPMSVGASDSRRIFYGVPEDTFRQELAERPLRGRISGAAFRIGGRIQMSPRLPLTLRSFRMLFQTWLDGSVADNGAGTRVTVVTRVFGGVGCFWLAVLGMTTLFAIATIGHPKAWPVLIVPTILVSLGVSAHFVARNDASFLLGLLASQIEATVIPS